MSHTPWTQEDVEKWAMESDVVRKATFEDDAISGFLAGMAKAAEMIEAYPTMYGNVGAYGSTFSTYPPGTFIQENNTHRAKLVGVRPIESDGSGSGAPKCAK